MENFPDFSSIDYRAENSHPTIVPCTSYPPKRGTAKNTEDVLCSRHHAMPVNATYRLHRSNIEHRIPILCIH